ncbi:MAG TPA: hypothetical protein VN282_07570 [Pyrinomonadaceae bacterium]|nr:hypothetical protein [Pyrinomonadaceae bacterium]
MDKPSTLEEYFEWAKANLSVDFTDTTLENLYKANLNNAVNAISESEFYNGIDAKLAEWSEEYYRDTKSQLLMDTSGLTLLKKPYSSAVDKSFRHNVLWNRRFPDEPRRGWITPDNFFSTLNDAIRSMLVCKFIDAPNFLISKLKSYADERRLPHRSYSQERDEGYYAFHFYAKFKIELLNKEWKQQEKDVDFEIQLTTQLQDILKNLTYPLYRQTRIMPEDDKAKWKWEYGTNRFRAGYLSHTLHLLEAIIVELREDKVSDSDESAAEGAEI